MIGDAALLLIVATVGIVWRMHETAEVPALIAFQALAYYSVARMLDHPASGSITLGVALAAAFLTRGWLGALPIMLAVPSIFMPCSVLWRKKKWLIATAAIRSEERRVGKECVSKCKDRGLTDHTKKKIEKTQQQI